MPRNPPTRTGIGPDAKITVEILVIAMTLMMTNSRDITIVASRLHLLGIPTISMTMTLVATVSERTKLHDEYYLGEGDLLLTI